MEFTELEAAFAGIEQVGKGELTFDLAGIPVTLRVVLPTEETEIQKYSVQALSEGDEDQATMTDYIQRFRFALLSYAIVQVGSLDFRDVEYVETGEKLENGQTVKLPRHLAVRKILRERFGGANLIILFRKYHELLEQVENEAEKAVVFKPVDYDAQIERHEKRASELRELRKEALEAQPDNLRTPLSDTVHSVAQGRVPAAEPVPPAEAETEEPAPPVPEPQPTPETPPAAPKERQPIFPQAAPPPSDRPESSAAPELDSPGSEMDQQETMSRIQSSFVDQADPDELERAMARENERLARIRQQRARGPQGAATPPQQQPPPQQQSVRQPPHMGARQVAEEVSKVSVEKVGEVGGVEAFRLGEDQVLTGKAMPVDKMAKVPVDNVDSTQGTRNPRFKAPPKGP